VANKPKNFKEIEKILSAGGLKDADSVVISKVFALVEDEFSLIVKEEFVDTSSQLDILTDILTRDGNCIMKLVWFSGLYDSEIKHINKQIKQLKDELDNPKSEITEQRKRTIDIKMVDTQYSLDLLGHQLRATSASGEQTVISIEAYNALRMQWLDFSRSIVDKIEPKVDVRAGINALRLALEIESLAQHYIAIKSPH
jgi:hypothetical protein